MYTHQATRWTQFITPLGGIIALTCFFLPWVEIDAEGRRTFIMSGVDFFRLDFLDLDAFHIAVAFIASAVIISLSLYMVIRRTPWKSRVPILMSAGIGLPHVLTDYFYRVTMSQFTGVSNYSTQLSFSGSVIGL